jgi:hypothetical protein
MFFLNTYRWDFPQVAALIAPRPLLIGNSDDDPLFPLDGVVRLYNQTRRIYQLYGKRDQLGLLITQGPHEDTQDLQLPVFRWFNRFLKGEDPLIARAATDFFPPEQLRVFEKLPEDQLNTTIEQSFVPKAAPPSPPGSPTEGKQRQVEYLNALRTKVFAGWPEASGALKLGPIGELTENGLRSQAYAFASQPDVRSWLLVLQDAKVKKPEKVLLTVLDAESWTNSAVRFFWLGGGTVEATAAVRQEMQTRKLVLAFFAPRGVEPSNWLSNPKKATQIRRRYMLLGQTLDGMRVWDIRRAAQAVKALPEFRKAPLFVRAKGQMGVNAAYAALFEPAIEKLELEGLPASQTEGPDYLNVLKVWDLPQLWDVLGERADVKNP